MGTGVSPACLNSLLRSQSAKIMDLCRAAALRSIRLYVVLTCIACCIGLVRLEEAEGGQAVRLLEESKSFASRAIPLAAAYNKTQPSTPAADHAEFDTDLRICVDNALARVRFLLAQPRTGRQKSTSILTWSFCS